MKINKLHIAKSRAITVKAINAINKVYTFTM